MSAYSQKFLVACQEKDVTFTPHIVNLFDPAEKAEYLKVNPTGKVPLVVLDDGWKIPESTIIIEYLDGHHAGKKLIPADKDVARRTRFMDRVADLYLTEPMIALLRDSLKMDEPNPARIEKLKAGIDVHYKLLDESLGKSKGPWAMGEEFTMADCSLTAPLFQLQRLHPFTAHKNLASYWGRLIERPTVKRVTNDAMAAMKKMMGRKSDPGAFSRLTRRRAPRSSSPEASGRSEEAVHALCAPVLAVRGPRSEAGWGQLREARGIHRRGGRPIHGGGEAAGAGPRWNPAVGRESRGRRKCAHGSC